MQNRNPSQPHDWTILSLLRWAVSYFTEKNIESPRPSAEILLAHALRLRRIDLYLFHDRPLLADELVAFKKLVRRRLAREPVAYILGTREFWSLDLNVTPDVLIPRPETECLVEAALAVIGDSGPNHACRVLELGTGSGAVTAALTAATPDLYLVATDISKPAIGLARRNVEGLGLTRRVRFVCADWFDGLKPGVGFNLILSNPPYIPTADIATLEPEIRGFEPVLALDGGADGLSALRRLIAQAPVYLQDGGWLLVEIGYDQRPAVETLAAASGAWGEIHFHRDYAGHHRVAKMRKSPR